MEATGWIYIICNTVNEKVYIGQTIDTMHRRMIKHRSDARRYARGLINPEERNKRGTCSKLYAAMNAHGIENFYMEEWENTTVDKLDDAETDTIELFDSVKKGYNLKPGGDRSTHCEETRKLISVRTREGIRTHIDQHRSHDVVKGMPMYCIFVVIKGSDAVAINRHPKCSRKSFTVRKYGSMDAAKTALLAYLTELEAQ